MRTRVNRGSMATGDGVVVDSGDRRRGVVGAQARGKPVRWGHCFGVGAEGSSPERRLHGGTGEAERLADVRLEEWWVAPVVGLESTGASR
jgi:hypothetical protein